MNISHTGSKLTVFILVLQWKPRKVSRGSGNPFEIVNINQASVLLLVLIYG